MTGDSQIIHDGGLNRISSLSELGPKSGTPEGLMLTAQAEFHHTDFDYLPGSPHLSHARLRRMLVDRLAAVIAQTFEENGQCRVLEVGGGHGTLTESIAALGADVTVTDMSKPSADYLAHRYRFNPHVTVVHDPDGQARSCHGKDFDLLVYISVLHHIPDYVGHVAALLDLVQAGGSLMSAQDPIWYARQGRRTRLLDRASYFGWRATQGQLRRGIATRVRRLRGRYEDRPEDMAEYHIVRSGVDNEALSQLLVPRFISVQEFRYWSTQSAIAQRLEYFPIVNTFGLVATGKL